ncbi:hypothetical protein [Rhodococcus sp. B50]|uniref:hypothetical protein n=1 Tax=Rhodococcus sp. B50 TaxID=2682847 RepID=UPI001FD621E6|nr:hypothetical protein [Rhodococcus sp. B50]MBS9376536.1 hypothetical protein [Rhodococcus sp. B50]
MLKPRGSAFGLFIDEMQDLDTDLLSALLTVQHRASQREWPFFLIGAGLPNLPAVLAENRSYAERQFLYSTVGPLDKDAAADALRIPVRHHGGDFTDDALDVLVTASGGYPYFLQEYGKAIWNLAPEAPFQVEDAELAVEVGRRHLDEGFFPSRWTRATDRERRYLRALAATGEDAPRSGKVAELMGTTASGVSDVRETAIKKGLIWAPEHGRIAFTVPGIAVNADSDLGTSGQPSSAISSRSRLTRRYADWTSLLISRGLVSCPTSVSDSTFSCSRRPSIATCT